LYFQENNSNPGNRTGLRHNRKRQERKSKVQAAESGVQE